MRKGPAALPQPHMSWLVRCRRPGSLFQDAVGAYASLNASFFSQYHTFGLVSSCREAGAPSLCPRPLPARRCLSLLPKRCACTPPGAVLPQHWVPREYIRWYIDGTLVYEVNKEALREQTNSTGGPSPALARGLPAVPEGACQAAGAVQGVASGWLAVL